MKVQMKGILSEKFPAKTGDKVYLTFVDLSNGGALKLTFPGTIDANPGQVVDLDLDVRGQVGKYGFNLTYVGGTFAKAKA